MGTRPTPPPRVQLFRYFEDYGISLEEVAQNTEYSVNYVRNIRSGSVKLSNSAIFRFTKVYPDTAVFLKKS